MKIPTVHFDANAFLGGYQSIAKVRVFPVVARTAPFSLLACHVLFVLQERWGKGGLFLPLELDS